MEQKFSIKAFIATFVLLSLVLFGFTYSKQAQYTESIKGRLHSVVVEIASTTDSILEIIVSDTKDEIAQDFIEEEILPQDPIKEDIAKEDTSKATDPLAIARNHKALVSVVIYDFGLSKKARNDIENTKIEGLTLSISPYAQASIDWVMSAQRFNAEPWTSIYLSKNNTKKDYGYLSIREGLSAELNNKRLEASLRNSDGTYGVINFIDSDKAGKETAILHEKLKDKGLSIAIFSKITNFWEEDAIISPYILPYNKSKYDIDDFFNMVTTSALSNGTAFIAIPPHPLVLKRLIKWSKQLKNKKIKIVPLSILMENS